MNSAKNKYHAVLANYFQEQECFFESVEKQRLRAKQLPPTSRPVNIRKINELPWQRLQELHWVKLAELFTDLQFLEAKAESGRIFDLAFDFNQLLKSIQTTQHSLLFIRLLEQAIRLDIHFIYRHPTTFFQCLWNSCWWFDCPDIENFCIKTNSSRNSNDSNKDYKLYKLMEKWRLEKKQISSGSFWVRSIRPYHKLNDSTGLLVLRGHLSPIQAVDFSPLGEFIASGSAYLVDQGSFSKNTKLFGVGMNSLEYDVSEDPPYPKDNSLRLWNSKNAKPDMIIESQEGTVSHCTYSPNGKYIAYICLPSGNVHIIEIATRNELTCFYGNNHRINKIAFSPDGQHIASAGTNGRIRIREVFTGADIKEWSTHRSNVTDVKYSPDGKFIASSSGTQVISSNAENALKIQEIESGKISFNHKSHSCIICIAYLPDGNHIIAGTLNNQVLVYNIDKGSETLLGKHEGEVLSVAVSPDGLLAVSGSTDNTVRLWNIKQRKEVACYQGHSDIITSVSFSPDGFKIASGSADCTARIWDVDNNVELQQEHIKHKRDIVNVCFSNSGNHLTSGSVDGEIYLYDNSGYYLKSFKDSNNLFKFKFSKDENRIYSTDNLLIRIHELTGELHYAIPQIDYDIETETANFSPISKIAKYEDRKTVIVKHSTSFEISDFVITSDDEQIIGGCWDGNIRIWNSVNGIEICLLRAENSEPIGLKYSEKKKRIIYSKEITCMELSQDNRFLACGSADGTVRLWDLIDLTGIGNHKHAAKVTSIAFSPDNSLIASGAGDGEIILWEYEGNNSIRHFSKHSKEVLNIAFSKHSKSIISASSEKTVIISLRNEHTRIFDGNGDVFAMSNSSNLINPMPMVCADETKFVDPATGYPVVWFPSSLKYLRSHPYKPVWIGGENNHLRMITMETF